MAAEVNSGAERRQLVLAVVLTLLGGCLLLATGGQWLVLAGLCAGIVFMALLLRHLEIGVYVLLAAALLLEQFQIFGFSNLVALKIPFYLNLNLVTGIGALVFNPVEALLGLMLGIWFLRAVVSREWDLRPLPNVGVAWLFLGMLIFFTAFGLLRGGGNWKAALWEIRALYYLCGCYFIAFQLIRTRRQVQVCVWIIAIAVGIKGLQGCWRYFVTLNGTMGDLRAITGHEDALFMVTAFNLMIAMALMGARSGAFWTMLATFPTTCLTWILTQRRITYGVFGLSLILITTLIPSEARRRAFKFVFPLLLVLPVYTAAFWNNTGAAGLPVRKVKSIFIADADKTDDSSNAYRKIENFNLQYTIRKFPLGLGFGQKYLIVRPLDKIDFPLWEYIPHNCILWMWAKTGFVGFTIFWLFFGTAIAQAVIDYRAMRDPLFRALGLMVITFIAGQLMVAYYDLQIVFFRNMIYLGIAMGLLAAIRGIEQRADEDLSP